MRQITVPILRSFDENGIHYVYAELPFEPDSFGTMLSQELVEDNLPRLKKFPTARFQHQQPIGIIDFENTVNGYRTYIDDDGFHVLIKLFTTSEKEFQMISQGSYGLSYGLLPRKTEHQNVNGKDVEVFTEGTLYEVSIVDSPALDSPLTILRSMEQLENLETRLSELEKEAGTERILLFDQNGYPTTEKSEAKFEAVQKYSDGKLIKEDFKDLKKRFTLQDYEVYEVQEDGSLSIPEPQEEEEPQSHIPEQPILRNIDIPNYEEQARNRIYPDICSDRCPFRTCPYMRQENYGKPCLQKFEQYKNR